MILICLLDGNITLLIRIIIFIDNPSICPGILLTLENRLVVCIISYYYDALDGLGVVLYYILTSLAAAAGICPTECTLALTNIAQTPVDPFHWKHTWFHRPLDNGVFSDATNRFLIVTFIVSFGCTWIRHNTAVSFLLPGRYHKNTFKTTSYTSVIPVHYTRVTISVQIIVIFCNYYYFCLLIN